MAKKITEEQKAIVRAMRQTGESYKKCAEKARISESAARRIVGEAVSQTREEESAEKAGKEKFVENAWGIINTSIDLIKKRLECGKTDLSALLDVLHSVTDGKELDDKEKNKLVFLLEKQAREATVPYLKELSSLVNVFYDKQALMQGKATQNVTVLSDEDRELLKKVNELCEDE